MKKKRFLLIVGLVTLITALHYFTSTVKAPLHIVYRELYFIPIVLAGMWAGKRGGLTCSIVVSFIYLPHIFILAESQPVIHHQGMAGMMEMMETVTNTADTYWGNVFQVLIFNLAGLLTGAYTDLKSGYVETRGLPYKPAAFGRNFLVYIEDSPASLHASKYVADIFGETSDLGVTLLWINAGTDPDYFESTEEASDYQKAMDEKGRHLLTRAKEILTLGGIGEDRIRLKKVGVGKKTRISDRILQELESGEFDTIVLGKHRLSRSQEFLFGSPAVRLVRESGINVIAVKGPEEAEKDQNG